MATGDSAVAAVVMPASAKSATAMARVMFRSCPGRWRRVSYLATASAAPGAQKYVFNGSRFHPASALLTSWGLQFARVQTGKHGHVQIHPGGCPDERRRGLRDGRPHERSGPGSIGQDRPASVILGT